MLEKLRYRDGSAVYCNLVGVAVLAHRKTPLSTAASDIKLSESRLARVSNIRRLTHSESPFTDRPVTATAPPVAEASLSTLSLLRSATIPPGCAVPSTNVASTTCDLRSSGISEESLNPEGSHKFFHQDTQPDIIDRMEMNARRARGHLQCTNP